jgi:hypothetical protein
MGVYAAKHPQLFRLFIHRLVIISKLDEGEWAALISDCSTAGIKSLGAH